MDEALSEVKESIEKKGGNFVIEKSPFIKRKKNKIKFI